MRRTIDDTKRLAEKANYTKLVSNFESAAVASRSVAEKYLISGCQILWNLTENSKITLETLSLSSHGHSKCLTATRPHRDRTAPHKISKMSKTSRYGCQISGNFKLIVSSNFEVKNLFFQSFDAALESKVLKMACDDLESQLGARFFDAKHVTVCGQLKIYRELFIKNCQFTTFR